MAQNAKIPTLHVASDFLESVDADNLKLVLQDIEEDITRVFLFVQPSASVSVPEQIKAAFREMVTVLRHSGGKYCLQRSWDVRLILPGKAIDAGQRNKVSSCTIPPARITGHSIL